MKLIMLNMFLILCTKAAFGLASNDIINGDLELALSENSYVNPQSVSDSCVSPDMKGPWIRYGAELTWNGNEKLLVKKISLKFHNSQLDRGYEKAITVPAGKASLSYLFGLASDYLPPKSIALTSKCFLDFGELPKPTVILHDNEFLKVSAVMSISGMTQDSDGRDEKTVTKEIPIDVIYRGDSVFP